MERKQSNAKGTLTSFNNGQKNRLRVEYQVRFDGMGLQVEYILRGDLDDLIVPAGGLSPQRKDDLWQTTCFECFFGRHGDSGYWETNLSPSGDWNLYRFSAYRQEMQEEKKVSRLDSDCLLNENEMSFCFTLSFSELLSGHFPIDIGLNTILHYTDNTKDYLALSHPGVKPDFHNRAGWRLSLSIT